MAEQTMTDLQNAAKVIEQQLALANSLAWTIDSAAHGGQIVSDGTTDVANITDQMVIDYNNAIEAVKSASYLTAQDVLKLEHDQAITNMHVAIDDLVAATAVLQTVSTVADMAADANTTQDQLQVQQALTTTDMSIDQADVDNYNTALANVESYAQEAGAFLAASMDSSITGAIDSFAQQNNVAVASYSAVSYTQSMDKFIIAFDAAGGYLEFNGNMADETLTAEDVYAQVGYVGN